MKTKAMLTALIAALSFGAFATDPGIASPEAPKVEVQTEPVTPPAEEKGMIATAIENMKSAAATAWDYVASDDDESTASEGESTVEAKSDDVPGDHDDGGAANTAK